MVSRAGTALLDEFRRGALVLLDLVLAVLAQFMTALRDDVVCSKVGDPADLAPLPLSRRAISIEALLEFTWEHNVWNLPTYQVVQEIIVPATAETKKPYIHLMAPHSFGEVRVFLSHAWSNPFGLIVATARKYIADKKLNQCDCFFWLDIFAITQHGGLFQAEELAQLEGTVLAADSTLLILDPKRGIPLERIWCIFEIFVTLQQGVYGKLQARVGEVNGAGELIPCVDGDVLRQLADGVDIKCAQATVASDREVILARIASMTKGHRLGIDELNRKLQRTVRQGWG